MIEKVVLLPIINKKELIIDNKLILNSYNGSNYDKIINSSIIKTLEILKSNNQKIKLNSIPIFINKKKRVWI